MVDEEHRDQEAQTGDDAGMPEVYWSEAVVETVDHDSGDTTVIDALTDLTDAQPAPEDQPDVAPDMLVPTDADSELRGIDLGPEHRTRWWLWAVLALVAIALVAGGAYGWWWMTEREIVVPDIVGKRPAEATQTLNDVALRLGKVSEVPTDSAPVGTIISQNPEAGARLKPKAGVAFVVAAAPEQTKVPNVVGLSADDAAELLAEARLRPFSVESYNETVAVGFVIGQVPDQGAELAPGTYVALAMSKGPAPGNVQVPDTVGLAEATARLLIEASGLKARIYSSHDASITVGEVITQTPLPSASVLPGTNVMVLVSKGAGTRSVTVPDVVGETRKDALSRLDARDLSPKTVAVYHDTVTKGRVISQMPIGGRTVAPGEVVGLLVSRGPRTDAYVPSVTATSSMEASTALAAAAFRAVFVEVETGAHPAGTVFAQFPASGSRYRVTYPVICLVATEVKP
jgi:serine/threonine-protein kinase